LGEGTIRDTFRLSGRGFVVTLEKGFSGKVRIGHVLESPAGRALINAVEFVLEKAGTDKEFVALLVDESAAPFFEKGQPVKFYATL
jgi:hypothetical protein